MTTGGINTYNQNPIKLILKTILSSLTVLLLAFCVETGISFLVTNEIKNVKITSPSWKKHIALTMCGVEIDVIKAAMHKE